MEVLSTLSNFGNIIPHDANSVVNLTLDRRCLGVAARLGSSARRGTAAGQVRVIGLGPVPVFRFRAICVYVIGLLWMKGRCEWGKGTSALGTAATTPVASLGGALGLVCLHIFDL